MSLNNRLNFSVPIIWASPVALTVKTLPIMWETLVQSLGQEDHLKGMATHLTGEFHGQRSLDGHSPCDCKMLGTTE